ncbi:YgzB family protein [Haloarchaeobius sp. HME9146]|uniref:YgzB family protein n=1 Tax=unclassified Haloarchaeobius TaxID=2614452 RepID=UPI0021C1303F|nr:YgzB family protein [Haloarchaeobius sp. HME9146]MCT9098037.1 YgzB family protein [Haloarchaeobius sp. HME9146]
MAVPTKSCQVTCPDCGQPFLVETARETETLRIECSHCEERITLPSVAFRPDERRT